MRFRTVSRPHGLAADMQACAGMAGHKHALHHMPHPAASWPFLLSCCARTLSSFLPSSLQLRSFQNKISRDADIVVAAMVSIVGSTLIFQGWRLDPLLLLCQALTTSVAVWYGMETFRLRSKEQEMVRPPAWTPRMDASRMRGRPGRAAACVCGMAVAPARVCRRHARTPGCCLHVCCMPHARCHQRGSEERAPACPAAIAHHHRSAPLDEKLCMHTAAHMTASRHAACVRAVGGGA